LGVRRRKDHNSVTHVETHLVQDF